MLLRQILVGLIGLSAGLIVAGGAIAFLIELGIVPRFACITHTARKILLYETCIMLGAVLGNVFYIYDIPLPLGNIFLGILGIFAGIFLGSWIIALAEVMNTFPVFARRVRLRRGTSLLMIAIALGKIIGSLTYFINRW